MISRRLTRMAALSSLVVAAASLLPGAAFPDEPHASRQKLCIAHGGAGAYAPFNSLASFRLALSMHPDYIETDLQLTKDGVLVCIHDPSLEDLTDVEEIYPDRFESVERESKPAKTWYVNDFTLSEIKKLDAGSWFDVKFKGEAIAAFQELIDLAKGKTGLYPEIKDPDFYRSRGVDIERALYDLLVKNGLDTGEAREHTPVIVQSFYESSLRRFRELGGHKFTLIQLVWFSNWSDSMPDAGLDRVASYADGIGPVLSMIDRKSVV